MCCKFVFRVLVVAGLCLTVTPPSHAYPPGRGGVAFRGGSGFRGGAGFRGGVGGGGGPYWRGGFGGVWVGRFGYGGVPNYAAVYAPYNYSYPYYPYYDSYDWRSAAQSTL